MKKSLIFLNLLVYLGGYCQLTVTLLPAPQGMADKQQLWNMILTNLQPQPLIIKISLTVTDQNSGLPVFTATTASFLLPQGTKHLSSAELNPIQYNSLNASYRIDRGPSGLLPIGSFNLCYNFLFEHISDLNKTIQECETILIPPLSPPLLTYPVNGSIIEDINPSFSWLPPAPINLFNDLQYTMKLVEKYPGQSAADAIQENIPLFSIQNVTTPGLFYNSSKPALQLYKEYAWQIIATNLNSKIAESEAWSFKLKDTMHRKEDIKPNSSYIKLYRPGTNEGYAIYQNMIRFDYLNETADTTWNIRIRDLTLPQSKSFLLDMKAFVLGKGQNLIEYDGHNDDKFINKHQYLLQLTNSRNEIWELNFEYRRLD